MQDKEDVDLIAVDEVPASRSPLLG
jgi:hypothetical protein